MNIGFSFWLMQKVNRSLPSWLFHARTYQIWHKASVGHFDPNHLLSNIRQATEADIPLLAQAQYSATTLRKWMTNGASAWFIADENNLLATIWLDASHCYRLYGWLELVSPSPVVWFLWWWVHPDYRRIGLAMRVRMPAAMAYREAGHHRGIAVVDALNHRAIKGVQKLGWVSINSLIVFRLCGLTFVYFDKSFWVGRWNATRPLKLYMEIKCRK